MANTYKYNDTTQLTDHFNVQEFKCKCGGTHNIKINPDLVAKLETLFEKLNCSKTIINSGHRCSAHDKAVGGSGVGQHVDGNAADIVCYDKSDNKISSKIVSCVAQDVGFGGIANIDRQYNAVHVDVRTSNFWKGDEVVTTAYSVTDDFYNYYGLSKNDVYGSPTENSKDTAEKFSGIDVSYAQGKINWTNVRTDFCIIQAGYGRELSQKDVQFENNYSGCKSNNIPCGAYWYSYAKSAEEAKKEAAVCLETIKNKQFEYPVYFDVEEPNVLALGKPAVSAIIRAFLETIEKAGYFVGLYMSASHLNDYVEDDIKQKYAVWVAHYGVSKPSYSGSYGMWQKSSTGKKNGISGNVDLDETYVDYPTIIKTAGLNGYPKPITSTNTAQTTTTAAKTQTGELSINGKKYNVTLTEKS